MGSLAQTVGLWVGLGTTEVNSSFVAPLSVSLPHVTHLGFWAALAELAEASSPSRGRLPPCLPASPQLLSMPEGKQAIPQEESRVERIGICDWGPGSWLSGGSGGRTLAEGQALGIPLKSLQQHQ